jgi:hypothetical protein
MNRLRIERYSFSLSALTTFGRAGPFCMDDAPNVHLRPQRMTTNVLKQGHIFFDRLVIGRLSVLTAPIDAYYTSLAYTDQVRGEFMRAMGCATREELYAKAKDNDWEIPDPGRVELPTMGPSTRVRIEGHCSDLVPKGFVTDRTFTVVCMFMGPAVEAR